MKKIILFNVIMACMLTASAQTETKGRPGVVIRNATATPALVADLQRTGMKQSFDRVAQSLDGHLAAAITDSRKFTVLVRGAQMASATDDISRIGQSLKLRENDYAILIDLDQFIQSKEKMGDLIKHRYQISGQVAIVGGVTAETLDMSNLQAEKVEVVQASLGGDARLDKMMPELAREFATKSFERLMSISFPSKVIDVDGDFITINRGEGFFAVGEKIQVFGKGRTVVDEDTGEKISIKGRAIGTATIDSVEPNYSQATTDGTFAVTKDAEVRKVQN